VVAGGRDVPTMLVMALDIRLDHSIVAGSDWETSTGSTATSSGRSLYRMRAPRVAYRLATVG
jgi:hypothetical protein